MKYIYIYICVCVCISSSSSCRAASTDIPDPLSPLLPIIHRVSSHSFWMYVRAGRPAFAWPYVGVHRSTSIMSSSLLLQQFPTCLVRITWIVFVVGGRWPYSWCLVGCCRQDLFNSGCELFLYRIYEEYYINLSQCSMYCYCYITYSLAGI